MNTWPEFKDVIEWFYTDTNRDVWYKGTQDVWSLVSTPTWIPGHKYVINDEHATARKHFADGYEIGRAYGTSRSWTKCVDTPLWSRDIKYTTKPQVLNQVLDGHFVKATDTSKALLIANGYTISISPFGPAYYVIQGKTVLSTTYMVPNNTPEMVIENGRFILAPEVKTKVTEPIVIIDEIFEANINIASVYQDTEALISTHDVELTLEGGEFEKGKEYHVVITEVVDE